MGIFIHPFRAAAQTKTELRWRHRTSPGAWAIMQQSMGSGATVQQILDRLNSTGVSITDSRNNITKKRIRVDAAIYAGGNPSLSNYSASWNSFGGTGSFNLNIAAGYGWNALSRDSWITTSSSNTGNGTIVVAGQTFTITQDAVSCNSSVSPGSANPGSGSFSGSFNVTRAYDCGIWYPSSNASWLTITSGFSGQGNGTVGYSTAANPNKTSRTATISVTGGGAFTVTQDGLSCASSLSSYSDNPNSSGGTNSFVVFRPAACPGWTAISTVTWITVTASGDGTTGNGAVNYSVAQNTTAGSRTGTISVSGGSTFTVTQSVQSCSYSVSPTSAVIGTGGGTTGTNVTAPNGGTWTAASSVNWVTITSGSSGSSNGTVNLSIAANSTTNQRVGTVTIAGQIFTVTQDGQNNCTYSVPSYQIVSSDGGYTTVAVTAPAGCIWSAVSEVSWIVITSGASGSGSGTVYLYVGANPMQMFRRVKFTSSKQKPNTINSDSRLKSEISAVILMILTSSAINYLSNGRAI